MGRSTHESEGTLVLQADGSSQSWHPIGSSRMYAELAAALRQFGVVDDPDEVAEWVRTSHVGQLRVLCGPPPAFVFLFHACDCPYHAYRRGGSAA